MATIHHGILGGFSGKVGNIVGYRYKSRYCIRQKPAKSSKPATVKQLAQRSRFGLSIAYLKQLQALMKPLPDQGKQQVSAYNICVSKVLKGAIAGSYPNFGINYPAVKLTSGSLYNGCRHSVFANDTLLTFSWCTGMYNCRFDGIAVLLAYNPEKEQWIYLSGAARAEDRTAELYLPCNFKGDWVETWLYFVSADGKRVSDSVYTGSVNIANSLLCDLPINLN